MSKDGERHVACCLEVDVAGKGESVDEALLVNLREALELCFEDEADPVDLQHPLVTPIEFRIPA